MPRTTVVLPVPGPPVRTKMPLVSAPSMAARWPEARRSPARASQSATSVAGALTVSWSAWPARYWRRSAVRRSAS